MNYFNTKFKIAEILHQPFSEIESLPFYEIEFLIDYLKERDEENKKSQKGESDTLKDMKNNYKIPKVSMPKIPKF